MRNHEMSPMGFLQPGDVTVKEGVLTSYHKIFKKPSILLKGFPGRRNKREDGISEI